MARATMKTGKTMQTKASPDGAIAHSFGLLCRFGRRPHDEIACYHMRSRAYSDPGLARSVCPSCSRKDL